MTLESWAGRRVLVTGHTGFKGAWLCLLLNHLGARVSGLALDPPTQPNLFDAARITELVDHQLGDIRDLGRVIEVIEATQPQVIIHMAAQPLVRYSYQQPVETYATNVMGTVHVLEATRRVPCVEAVVNVTTDKCYENREWLWGYREHDPMGGHDPYSNSKGCSELVTAAYRQSFFGPAHARKVSIASARAGNVIGGGDWAHDRLIPDCVQAMRTSKPIPIRSPDAVRPWQWVLEPLVGYLTLAQRLLDDGESYAQAWNFGPSDHDAQPVRWVVDRATALWGDGATWEHVSDGDDPHEAYQLKLDCSKAHARLGWRPRTNLSDAIDWTIDWYRRYEAGTDVRELTLEQIDRFLGLE